ncbi:MAG: two pore domain potassium channel family protein [Candidatus Omnitrophica bacterium]|nr:two pore domain potassium channel family protein [Candidatus Omnitrophota bacterium]
MWSKFEESVRKEDWRRALRTLLEIAKTDANELRWNRKWISNINVVKKLGIRQKEKDCVMELCEKAISFARKILIEARLHDEARRLYIKQMRFRAWLKWRNGDRSGCLLNWSYWLLAGYKKSHLGLMRFFSFISFVVLGSFALLYRFPSPKIEYVSDPSFPLSWAHYIYFSGMALTTVGYGDIHPKPDNELALILSVVEACLGYILLGMFVAFLVAIEEPVAAPVADWDRDLFSKLPPAEAA